MANKIVIPVEVIKHAKILAKIIAKKHDLQWHDIDNLVQEALIAYTNMIDRVDASRYPMTYIRRRMFGAMYDYMRTPSFDGRTRTQKQKSTHFIFTNLHRDEDRHEHSCPNDVFDGEDNSQKHQRDLKEAAEEVLSVLTKRKRAIMRLHFLEEASQRDIGKYFNVSEGRISQIIKECKTEVKRRLCRDS